MSFVVRYRVDPITPEDLSIMAASGKKHEVKTVLSVRISGSEGGQKLHQSLDNLCLEHPLMNWTREDVRYFLALFSLSLDTE